MTLTYDQRNELVNETLSGTGLNPEAVKFAYDNAGNMTGLTRYADLAETTVVASTSYTYDAAHQMTGITDKNSGGTTLVSFGYTYDAAARVTQETRTGGREVTLYVSYCTILVCREIPALSRQGGALVDQLAEWLKWAIFRPAPVSG